MVRFSRSCIVALTVVATTACGGDALSPRADATSERARLKITTHSLTETSADITVDSKGGSFHLGRHSIKFPRNSICALKSSYGESEWDKPCTPASEPVDFHVEIVSRGGRQWLDFTPAARFVPTNDPKQYVMLTMRTEQYPHDEDENELQILWSPEIGVAGIDESLSDPSMRTTINRRSGSMSRRIKHFSGYNVSDRLGFACEPTDASCVKDVVLDAVDDIQN